MLLQSNSETVINHKGKEIPKDIYIYIYIYISLEKRKLLILLVLIQWYNNGISKNNKFVRQCIKSTN